MDSLTVAAASGMRSRTESLDMLANNIANASSAGFKADREFYGVYSSAEAEGSANSALPELPFVAKHWTDFSQGSLSPTGNSLDVALAGNGFFAVQTASGPLYTRDGSFKLSAAGALETQDGNPVLSSDKKPITLDPSQAVDIAADGTIRQGGQDVGQLAVVEFSDLSALSKRGKSYFGINVSDLPTQQSQAQVHQGSLEGANQQPAEAAVRLVNVLRQFEMLQRAMTMGGDMNRRAIEEVAKVA